MFQLTRRSRDAAPDTPRAGDDRLRERAAGARSNGETLAPVALVETLNEIAGRHGVGRDRPRREPAGRHEVARRLRDARRARCSSRGARGRSSRSRSTATARTRRPSSARATPSSSTSGSGSRRCARRSRRSWTRSADRDRRGDGRAVQGERPRSWAARSRSRSTGEPRVVRHDRLRRRRRGGLHPAVRPADERAQAPEGRNDVSGRRRRAKGETVDAAPSSGAAVLRASRRVLRACNDSFGFDRELLAEDVAGSIAWAEALGRPACCRAPRREARPPASRRSARRRPDGRASGRGRRGRPLLRRGGRSRRRIGPLAGKLHTGRSRNDQVATDLRL